eukprot:TRINITY_DN490_c0_g1_i1.p1 TRINITY_DN490_c0_g1~~TRINITY_DN490_c0_g1_i1.p1  ORF type:complete len:242 (-),score=64.67 TRINITY_DN490_c0_g1_i1:1102-1827(-)
MARSSLPASPRGAFLPRTPAWQLTISPSSTPSEVSSASSGSSLTPPPPSLASPLSPVKGPKPSMKKFFSQQFSRRPAAAAPSLSGGAQLSFARSSLAEQRSQDKPLATLALSGPAASKRRDSGLFANLSRLVRSKDDLDPALGLHPVESPDNGVLRSKSLVECLLELDEEEEEEEEAKQEGSQKAKPRPGREGLSRPSSVKSKGGAPSAGGQFGAKRSASVWSSAKQLLNGGHGRRNSSSS